MNRTRILCLKCGMSPTLVSGFSLLNLLHFTMRRLNCDHCHCAFWFKHSIGFTPFASVPLASFFVVAWIVTWCHKIQLSCPHVARRELILTGARLSMYVFALGDACTLSACVACTVLRVLGCSFFHTLSRRRSNGVVLSTVQGRGGYCEIIIA